MVGGASGMTPSDMWERAVPGSRAKGRERRIWATVSERPTPLSCSWKDFRIVSGLPEMTGNPTKGLLTREGSCRTQQASSASRFTEAPSSRTAGSNRLRWRVRGFVFANLNSDPKPRTSEMDEGSQRRRRRAVCWTLRAAGTASKVW